MKKIILSIASIFVILALVACGRPTFKILLPTEYLAEELIDSFQKEHGVRVKAIPFTSNEAAITRLRMEKFDLIIPSDYAAEQLIEEDLILPLEWDKITAVDRENGFPEYMVEVLEAYENDAKPLVLLDYMVPYFWGNLGITYNKNKVTEEELEQEQWGIFLRDDLKKAVYDSSRDAFLMALKHLGYSANTEDESELEAAEDFLKQVDRTRHVVYLTDDILDDMQKDVPEYDIALTYSGDALYIKLMSDKPEIGYYTPTVGTNIFIDGISIPKSSKHIDLAYAFINHVSKHENGVINMIDVAYVSAIKSVYEYTLNDEASPFYPYRDFGLIHMNENDELFRYVPASKKIMDDAWSKIRSGS